jgi:hypothetical protein
MSDCRGEACYAIACWGVVREVIAAPPLYLAEWELVVAALCWLGVAVPVFY